MNVFTSKKKPKGSFLILNLKSHHTRLFRKNALLEDPTEIDERIEEAETRIEIALHYKIPYPR